MILNLKPLNEFVDRHYFKKETLRTALKLIRPRCFTASVDIKGAYYSIPIAEEDRKFLMFERKGKYYQYTLLPDDLSSALKIFTKIVKPVYANLRSVGHICIGHVADSLFIGQNFSSFECNVVDTVSLFTNFGFTIYPDQGSLYYSNLSRK